MSISQKTANGFYDKAYFEKGGYNDENGKPIYDLDYAKRRALQLESLLDLTSVLDCGCANGCLLHGFKMLSKDIEVAGFDISDYAVQNVTEEIRPCVRVGDITEHFPYETNGFDLVVGFDVLEHIHGYDKLMSAVSEMCRVAGKWILLRQPMTLWHEGVAAKPEEHSWIVGLNPLTHKARVKLVGWGSKMQPSWPTPVAREHPAEHPREFWIVLFSSFGFQERALPEEMYVFPNDLMFNSFNVLLFEVC